MPLLAALPSALRRSPAGAECDAGAWRRMRIAGIVLLGDCSPRRSRGSAAQPLRWPSGWAQETIKRHCQGQQLRLLGRLLELWLSAPDTEAQGAE